MAQDAKQTDFKIVERSAVQWANIAQWYRTHINSLRPAAKSKAKARPASLKQLLRRKTKDGSSEAKKLDQVVAESQETIATATTVFPLTLFRTVICVDRHKLSIMRRTFFKTGQVISVPIENIKNVQASVGPFFGSLVITSEHFVNNIWRVNYLYRQDALKIQRLIQGAMVAKTEEIDISQVEPRRLKKALHDLGEGI